MIQANNTTSIDETDGLPMPRRIWAVVSIGFALCMSVLDVNIINIVLPTLSHDFGTSPAVTTWIINGYQLAIVVSLLSFSSLGEIIGYRKVFLSGIGLFCITSLICALSDSFWTLTIARIFQGFSPGAPGVRSVGHHKCEYGAAALRIPEKPDRAGNGNQCDGSGDIGGCRSVGGKRHTFDSQLALAVCYQCTAGDYGTATGYQAFAETGRAVEAEV